MGMEMERREGRREEGRGRRVYLSRMGTDGESVGRR